MSWPTGSTLSGRVFVVFVLRSATAGLAVVSTFVIARLFGAGATGTYYLGVAAATVGMTIGRVGLDLPVMRIVAVDIDRTDWPAASGVVGQATRVIVMAAGLMSLLLFVLAGTVGSLFGDPGLPGMLRLVSLAVVPGSLTIMYASALRGASRPGIAEVIERGVFLAFFILGVLVFAEWMQQRSMGLAYTMAYGVTASIAILAWRRVARGARPSPIRSTRSLVAAGLPLLLASSVTLAMGWTDVIMIGLFGTPADVGVYSISVRVASLISFVLVAAGAVVGPRFAAVYADGDSRSLQRLVSRSTLGTGSAALALTLFLIATRTAVLGAFGDEFVAGASALMFLAIGQLVHSGFGLIGMLLAMTGRERRILLSTSVGAAANVALNLLLIPRFGIEGAAFASMLSIVVVNVANALFVRFDLGIVPVGQSR